MLGLYAPVARMSGRERRGTQGAKTPLTGSARGKPPLKSDEPDDAMRAGAEAATSVARTVLLVDEMPLLRDSLVDLLQEHCRDLFFIAAGSGTEQKKPLSRRPDLIIINARNEKIGSEWLQQRTEALSGPYGGAPILLISELEMADEAQRAIEAGYAGFLPSTQSGEQLVAAIRVILAGGRFHLFMNEALPTQKASEEKRTATKLDGHPNARLEGDDQS